MGQRVQLRVGAYLMLPAWSNARTCTFIVLGCSDAVITKLYGDVLSVWMTLPLMISSSRFTPFASLAVALIVTLPLTLALFAGALVIVTSGSVLSAMTVRS